MAKQLSHEEEQPDTGTDFGNQIWSGGPILAAKSGPGGPILAAKIGPGGPLLAIFFAKIGLGGLILA